MLTIAIHNTKGGVGTTTLAAHLCFLCKERGLRVGAVPDPRTADLAIWLDVADIRCSPRAADLDPLDVLVLDRPALDDLDLDPDLWIIPITDRAGIDHAAALSDRLCGKIVWLGNLSRALTYCDVPIYLLHDITLAETIPFSRAIAHSTERLGSVWSTPDLAKSPGGQALRRTLGALLDDLLHDHRPPASAPATASPLDSATSAAPRLDDDALAAEIAQELAEVAEERRELRERHRAPRRVGVNAPTSVDPTTTIHEAAAPPTTTASDTNHTPPSASPRERDVYDELAALSRSLGRAIATDPSSAANPEPVTIDDFLDPLRRLSPHISALLGAPSPARPAAEHPRDKGFAEPTSARRSDGLLITPECDPNPRTAAPTDKPTAATSAPPRAPNARSRTKSRTPAK